MESAPTVTEMMAAYAKDAIEHARSASGVALDYSPDSIRNVESVLQTLYAALPRGFLGRLFGRGPSAQDLDTVCKMYGGYVGAKCFAGTAAGSGPSTPKPCPGRKASACARGR